MFWSWFLLRGASATVLYRILTLIAIGSIGQVTADLFPTPKFSGDDVTSKVFGAGYNKDIFPVAYGDFNADKHTDIIALTHNRSSIIILFSYDTPPYLRTEVQCDIKTDKSRNVEVIGAAPGDFTGDGVMDLLVTIQQEGQKSVEVIVFEGNSTYLICENRMGNKKTIQMVQEPLVVDLNGDMIMDLVGEVYHSSDFNEHGKSRKVWIFKEEHKLSPIEYNFTIDSNHSNNWEDHEEHGQPHKSLHPMPIPSSNAFVDLDGDSIPELVIFSQAIEENTNKREYFREVYKVNVHEDSEFVSFSLQSNISIDNNKQTNLIGQSIFVDLNQEGKLLHVLPYCTKLHCGGDLESNKQGFKLIYNETTILDIPLGSGEYGGKQWRFVTPVGSIDDNARKKENFYWRTFVFRVGDYNLDGYPDLIGILKSSDVGSRQAVIFENVPCKDLPTEKCAFPRTLNPNFNVLSKYNNVSLATFFDIHEDGLIDVLVVRRSNNDTKPNSETYEVRAFQNSPDYDSNFIKVMVLTGRKCPKCPKGGIPYGNVIPGPVISYKTKTQTGALQTAVAAQSYRSSHMPMDLPYTIFGIGHSPNFVETLKISVSQNPGKLREHEWPQIIPNSQIIVIPDPLGEPRRWKAKLFLTPSDAVFQTFAVLLAICLVVFCIVVGLHFKEYKEDRRDRLQEAHRFMM